jgi:hypothetical protein
MPTSIRHHLAIVPCFASLALLVACGDGSEGSGGEGGAGGHGGAATTNASSSSRASTSAGASGNGSSGASSSSSGASSSSGGGAVDCKSLPLCDDFEGATAGGPPGGKWSIVSPSCSGTGTVAVDGAMAHSGTKSVKVTGKAGYCDHVFISNQDALAAVGKVVFGRFFMRLSSPLGDIHTTFMAMTDTADGGKNLRMGGQSKILMWNRESDDATMPALSPVGISKSLAPTTNQWLCVEFMVDGTKGFMQTWVDGTEVLGLHVDDMPTPDVDQQWLNKAWKPSLVDWKLGWESYGAQDMTLWFDDVALAAQRIGCK